MFLILHLSHSEQGISREKDAVDEMFLSLEISHEGV